MPKIVDYTNKNVQKIEDKEFISIPKEWFDGLVTAFTKYKNAENPTIELNCLNYLLGYLGSLKQFDCDCDMDRPMTPGEQEIADGLNKWMEEPEV